MLSSSLAFKTQSKNFYVPSRKKMHLSIPQYSKEFCSNLISRIMHHKNQCNIIYLWLNIHSQEHSYKCVMVVICNKNNKPALKSVGFVAMSRSNGSGNGSRLQGTQRPQSAPRGHRS